MLFLIWKLSNNVAILLNKEIIVQGLNKIINSTNTLIKEKKCLLFLSWKLSNNVQVAIHLDKDIIVKGSAKALIEQTYRLKKKVVCYILFGNYQIMFRLPFF